MRKALLICGICILAAPAWAGGGYSLFGSYSELNEDATAAGVGVRVSAGGTHWLGDLSWTWLQGQDGITSIAGFEDTLQVIPTDLGVRYLINPRGSVSPYLGAGVTFFYVNLYDGSADNTFGGYGLLGLNFGTGRAKIFVEGIYRVGTSDVSYRVTPIESTSGSMDVGGFGANLGVMWVF